ncbi:hypothetical protein RQP46_004638 [Phenoliferia psychrophenolica]
MLRFRRILASKSLVSHSTRQAHSSAMSCPDCLNGAIHEGTPVGKTETIAGVATYVSLPPAGTYDKDKAVVFLGDIFGQYANAKLLADSFAANGFATYFPDYLHGDPVPLESMNAGATFDRVAWKEAHPPSRVRSGLDPVLKYLREAGVSKIGATGYCFGGKYVSDLAIENAIEAGVAAHPANIIVPDDIEAWLAKSKVPLLFNACEIDQTWPQETQALAAKLMASYGPGWKQNYYAGCRHGFGTRADLSIPEQKHGKEDAFKETVEWFKKYLV